MPMPLIDILGGADRSYSATGRLRLAMKQHLPAIYQSEDLVVVDDLLAGTDKVQCRIGLARVGVTRGVATDNARPDRHRKMPELAAGRAAGDKHPAWPAWPAAGRLPAFPPSSPPTTPGGRRVPGSCRELPARASALTDNHPHQQR